MIDPLQFGRFESAASAAADAAAGPDRAPRPRRLAVLGWARLAQQGREGSGYNLNVSELCAGLARRGHRVFYLRAGIDYSIWPGVRIEPLEVWRGVACFDLVNSANLATGNHNLHNPHAQIASPHDAASVLGWLDLVEPDAVHVHSLEGFPFELIGAIAASGRRIVVTPHNFFYLCGQVDLLWREREVCVDYDGGRRCETCLAVAPPGAEILARRRRQSLRRVAGRTIARAARDAASTLARRLARRSAWPHALAEVHDLGPPLDDAPAPDGSALADEPASDQRAACESLTRAADVHLRVLDAHGERRRAGVAALNHAHAVLCPGEYLMRVHRAFGVDPARLRHVPLGQPHFDRLRDAARRSPFYDRPPWSASDATRPLRLAFYGNCHRNKGLHVLVEAMRRLEDRDRVHLTIRAAGDDAPFRARLAGIDGVLFEGGYDLARLEASLPLADVVVCPNIGPENSPMVVLEAHHAGRFVIGSDLGATGMLITPGRNGLYARAASPTALADAIGTVLRGEVPLPSPRQIHDATPHRPHESYVLDVERSLIEP